MVKRKPHHDLAAVQLKFGDPATLQVTTTAARSALELGFGRTQIVAVVQALARADFVKSETAHSPPNSRVWHDTYVTPFDGKQLYLKFAGETLVDLTLTSFKERSS